MDSMQALLFVEQGRANAARERLERHSATRFGDVPVNNTWLMTLTNWAAVSASAGHHTSAEQLAEILTPYAEQLPLFAGTPNPVVAFYLGLLAATVHDYEEAESHFRIATTFHTRIGAPIWLARTRLEWARMLLDRQAPSDHGRAQQLLTQALTTARELGLAKIEHECCSQTARS
jgi:hypothetical protein